MRRIEPIVPALAGVGVVSLTALAIAVPAALAIQPTTCADLEDDPNAVFICAGPGADRVSAGTEHDEVNGGGGADRLIGGTNLDYLNGQGGRDVLKAIDGELDFLNGGPRKDTCETDDVDSVEDC